MANSDQFDLGLAWPSSEDDLFNVSGPATGHAIFDWRRDTIVGRMDGYRRAAEVLAEHALAHPGDLAFLVYPIANCWRHHIELQLKDLLRLLQELLGEAVTSTRGHNVLGLWQEVEPRLVAAYPEEPHVDDDNIGRILHQLHTLDPDGQNFRYHRRTDGSVPLKDIDRLDVRAWHNVLIGVSNFLQGTADMVADHD